MMLIYQGGRERDDGRREEEITVHWMQSVKTTLSHFQSYSLTLNKKSTWTDVL